jgi:hypothetical protein
MKKQDKNVLLIVGLIILFLLVLPQLKFERFAVADSDFTCDTPITITLPNPEFSLENGLIIYYDGNITRSLSSGQVYYLLDNNLEAYDTFPEFTGTHNIKKIKISLINNGTEIYFESCHILYTKEIQVQNITVYQNITKYVNQTVEKIVEKTVEKEVMIEPTLGYILKTYKYYIIGIVLIGIVAYIYNKRRKK